MKVPKRLRQQAGRYALVDGIPFKLPVGSRDSAALIAAFSIDAEKAKRLLPGNELHLARIFNRGVLFVTVVKTIRSPTSANISNTLSHWLYPRFKACAGPPAFRV
jgi:hypothetical protein